LTLLIGNDLFLIGIRFFKSKRGNKMSKETKWLWWLLPIFLNIIGGVIGYFMLKDKDPGMAKNILLLGVVLFLIMVVFGWRGLSLF